MLCFCCCCLLKVKSNLYVLCENYLLTQRFQIYCPIFLLISWFNFSFCDLFRICVTDECLVVASLIKRCFSCWMSLEVITCLFQNMQFYSNGSLCLYLGQPYTDLITVKFGVKHVKAFTFTLLQLQALILFAFSSKYYDFQFPKILW